MTRTLLAIVLLPIAAAGCADGTGREAVSGSARLKGQPLPDGAIVQFEPLDQQGTEAAAVFTGGRYSVPKANGLKPGKYRVRLTAGDGKTAVNPTAPDQPPGPGGGTNIISKDLIPPDWGVKSRQEITVAAGGPNVFDFDIP